MERSEPGDFATVRDVRLFIPVGTEVLLFAIYVLPFS